ncbi:MAG: hypothetical protein CMB11_04720 [Euryarchaeota archaeon]|nr:hypothetical protein [Euryarchaeota archaeon]
MMKRSRSVFEPRTAPMCADFEDAGVAGAMSRLLARLRQLVEPLTLPSWLWSLDFTYATAACAAHPDVQGLVQAMDEATRALGGKAEAAHPCAATAVQLAAVVRLRFGVLLEALASGAASVFVAPEEAPGSGVDRAALAALYYDAYCAAVWTSAHAEFLATIEDLLAGRPATEALVRDLMVPPPDLYTVANLSHLAHLGPLSDRLASPRCCSKTSQSLLAILTRVTNAGSRGWETTLLTAAKDSDGAVRVCTQCVAVALSGMHPAIHPAARRPWRERFVLLRALRVQTTQDFKELVHKAPNAVKEAIRLHLAAVYSLDCATLNAMRQTRQPTGQLGIPPLALPHPSLAAAMHRMAEAGAGMLETRESAAASIQRHLVSEPRSRKKSSPSTSARAPKHEAEPLSYCASWLGGRSGPVGATVRSAVQVVSGLMSASYRSIYIPWWLHGNHHGHRASRLDSAQYVALHNRSAAHRMCTLLSDEDFQMAERTAIGAPDASLLTVGEACALLGIRPSADEPPGVPCAASSRAVQEAEVDVMNLCARDAALLIAFARIASLRATLLSYDLGEGTRRRQALAICQRLMLPLAPDEDPCAAVRSRLPEHATVLYFCSECRRIVNAVQDNAGKDQPFNELGLSASMLAIDGDLCNAHMRCAKRSSAALRTAVALEAAAEALKLEKLDPVASPLLPRDLRPATVVATMCCTKGGKRKLSAAAAASAAARDSSSEVAKFRRDLKSCYEQSDKATSCGDVPLVQIPILGRVVRVFGNFYAICAMCGALTRVAPSSRFRNEICCMRCDFAMLAGKVAAAEMHQALPRPPPPSCRYCGKQEPENGAGMKWRCIEAPADTGGRNASVPPPLRTVFYCPTHYRGWLVAAHKTMSTATIFAHLMNKARPLLGANNADANVSKRKGRQGQAEARRPTVLSKSKTALAKTIGKNHRQRKRS